MTDSPVKTVATWLTDFKSALEKTADGGNWAQINRVLSAGATMGNLLSREDWSGLTDPERRIFLVSAGPELDLEIGRLYAKVSDQFGVTRPSVAVCLELASSTAEERLVNRSCLLEKSPLIEGGWLRIEGSNNRPWLEHEVRVANAAIQRLLGQSMTGVDSDSLCRVWDPEPTLDNVILPSEDREQLGLFIERARHPQNAGCLVMLLCGPSGTGKTITARATAAFLKKPLLLVDPIGGMLRRDSLEGRLEQLAREARLLNAVLFFDECEGWYESRLHGDRTVLRMLELLDRLSSVVILATNMPDALDPALDRRVAQRIEFDVPTRAMREELWRCHLRDFDLADDVDLSWLAERYELTGGHIANATQAAAQASKRSGTDSPVSLGNLEQAADQQVRHRLSRLAVETPTSLGLSDLVVPEETALKLDEIISAVRNRRMLFEEWGFGKKLSTGRGLCILFRGDPGTGKTLAAEVIACELKMPLYRASVAKIVSKYVGETERNLTRTFKEATTARGILLFDEADAIFSKRVDVSSAQDRYSNMEVNLLLQEIERFDGVVILTTNLTANIDDAFDRRLNFKIDFPFPEGEDRAKIWQLLIPDQAPTEGVIDYAYLGETYELAGGSIKNVVVRAAYAAARKEQPISSESLESACRTEYRELGKLISDREWDTES